MAVHAALMGPAARHFAQSYAEARSTFAAAADAAGLDVHAWRHPMRGRDGEELALDVARFGEAGASALLLLSSGCHGVEGFAGSAVQVALLSDPAFHDAAAAAGVAVLYVHALNPYGFSWWRRATHENVDLNRNVLDFGKPLPRNAGYAELARAIVPASWPPPPSATQALAAYGAAHGMRALQAVLSAGQYDDPDGLFFGGHDPTWSQQCFRHVLQEHGRRCRRLGWIDLHTGLGECGHGERICNSRDDAAALARARLWWGPQVTSVHDGSSAATQPSGMLCNAVAAECPQAQITAIALEFGTLPALDVLQALRAEQWLENHPEAGDAQRGSILRAMRDAFYVDTDDWKERVLTQAHAAALQALAGLRA